MRRFGSTKGRLGRGAVLLLLAVLAPFYPGWSQSPVFSEPFDVDQQKLQDGLYPLFKVLESGGQFFSTPYLPYDASTGQGDGYGEGQHGPRRAQQKAFYPPAAPTYPFLRLNGLDSQSCFECHNSIGSYTEPGSKTGALMRKPGAVGGSAGSNSNAFINPNFPLTTTLFIRQPPHVFGTGYTQQVAFEITQELAKQRGIARIQAQKQPGVPQEVALTSKGLSYGRFKTTYIGKNRDGKLKPGLVLGCDDLCAGETPQTATFSVAGYVDDVSRVNGVPCDLIVRPFQWKGISSSIRHFARDATDFHFSMQAVEKYGDLDCDRDGKRREFSLGNMSALVSFVTMTRPPRQVLPEDANERKSALLGEEIFKGHAADPILQARLVGQMCANCHMPALTLNKAELFIDNPGEAQTTEADCRTLDQGLVDPVPSHSELEVYRRTEGRILRVLPAVAALPTNDPDTLLQELEKALAELEAQEPMPGYTINLSDPGPFAEVPAYVFPRLPVGAGGTVSIPLFSDLRTHNLGPHLQDRAKQGADVAGICIDRPLFLTRPLWGVADTGPWLHDGRALTLRDAILLHQGKDSEANPVIAAFLSLTSAEQQAVVDFLLTLRLVVQPGLTIEEYVDDPGALAAGAGS